MPHRRSLNLGQVLSRKWMMERAFRRSLVLGQTVRPRLALGTVFRPRLALGQALRRSLKLAAGLIHLGTLRLALESRGVRSTSSWSWQCCCL